MQREKKIGLRPKVSPPSSSDMIDKDHWILRKRIQKDTKGKLHLFQFYGKMISLPLLFHIVGITSNPRNQRYEPTYCLYGFPVP